MYPEFANATGATLQQNAISQLLAVTIAQDQLGHADISMTRNRYSHVTPDMQRSTADTLDAVFTRVS